MTTSDSAELARRLIEVREELYGEYGGPLLAERIRVPFRTWFNYESGVTIPGVILLRFIEITGTCPKWLASGEGSKYVSGDRTSRVAVLKRMVDPAENWPN